MHFSLFLLWIHIFSDEDFHISILRMVFCKVLIHPNFNLAFLIDCYHFLIDIETPMFHIQIEKAHQGLEQHIETLFKGKPITNLA